MPYNKISGATVQVKVALGQKLLSGLITVGQKPRFGLNILS